MKKRLLFFLFVFAFFIQLKVYAQSDLAGWVSTFNTVKVSKKLSIHSDFQWRSTAQIKHTQSVLLRAGLNYHLPKNWVVTGGYAFIRNRRIVGTAEGRITEHRIWQQLLHSHRLKPIYITHRFRIEQRFIGKPVVENNDLKTDGYAYANRFRYFIRNLLPLQKQQPVFEKGPYVALQNEVFLNFGNKANVNGEFFDQNRLYLALGFRASRQFDIEAGGLLHSVNPRAGNVQTTPVVQLAGYLRL